MKTELPGNLEEIFPLRLRTRSEITFSFRDGKVEVVLKPGNERFMLSRWQYELMSRFDGEKTFEEAAREVYRLHEGNFTAIGLLNFYRWLYDEDIVFCECESVFELAFDDDEEDEEEAPVSSPRKTLSHYRGTASEKIVPVPAESLIGRVRSSVSHMDHQRLLKVSAMIIGSLALLRIAYVLAPLAGPPTDRLVAEVSNLISPEPVVEIDREQQRTLEDTETSEIALAGRVELESKPVPDLEIPEIPEVAETSPEKAEAETTQEPEALVATEEQSATDVSSADIPPAPPERSEAEVEKLRKKMEALRQELTACQIRRDEFYIQSNEEGYRKEVEHMTELVRKIGRIESEL